MENLILFIITLIVYGYIILSIEYGEDDKINDVPNHMNVLHTDYYTYRMYNNEEDEWGMYMNG